MAAQAQLRIEVSDPGLAQSLSNFLEHTIYRPGTHEGTTVLVAGPEGLPHEIARAEVDRYVEAWRRFHPEAVARLID